jgi:thioredoxin-dependent peroxiredoxin
MIDPPKATKGRRMSKKTRKKSSKAPAGKVARAASTKSARTPAAKARKASPRQTAPKAGKQTGTAAPKASRKAASKPLKVPTTAAPRATAASNKPTAAKPQAGTRLAGKPMPEKAGPVAEGAKAPAFRLPRDGGETVALSDFAGRKLVLFFYPRADTPGCTKEAIDFTRLAGSFAESQTAVLGVSADPPRAQEAFRDKHQLATPLVSDEQHGMLQAYGVWGEKSMYGRTFQGIIRTTVLIGADGRIIRIWRHVKVDGHADEVLAAAQAH